MTDQQDLRARLLIRAESMALMLDEQTANLLREAAAQLPAGVADAIFRVGGTGESTGYGAITFMPYRAAHDGQMCLSIRHAGGDTGVPITQDRDIVLWERLHAMLAAAPQSDSQKSGEGEKVPGCEDCAYNGRHLCDEHGPRPDSAAPGGDVVMSARAEDVIGRLEAAARHRYSPIDHAICDAVNLIRELLFSANAPEENNHIADSVGQAAECGACHSGCIDGCRLASESPQPVEAEGRESLFAQSYRLLAKAVSEAGFYINTENGSMYLTPKESPPPEQPAIERLTELMAKARALVETMESGDDSRSQFIALKLAIIDGAKAGRVEGE